MEPIVVQPIVRRQICWFILAVAMLLSACGQRGPLYIPGKPGDPVYDRQNRGSAPAGNQSGNPSTNPQGSQPSSNNPNNFPPPSAPNDSRPRREEIS